MAMLALSAAAPGAAAVQTRTVEYRQGDAVLEGYLAYDDEAADRRSWIAMKTFFEELFR
jgi:hypothetical protein